MHYNHHSLQCITQRYVKINKQQKLCERNICGERKKEETDDKQRKKRESVLTFSTPWDWAKLAIFVMQLKMNTPLTHKVLGKPPHGTINSPKPNHSWMFQLTTSSTHNLVNLQSHQTTTAPTHQLINPPTHGLIKSQSLHLTNSRPHQPTTSSTYQLIYSPTHIHINPRPHQLTASSTYQLITSPTHNLINPQPLHPTISQTHQPHNPSISKV